MAPTIDFNGTPIPILLQHQLELRDLSWIKEQFEISGIVELEDGLAAMEPDAWQALLVASIRRHVETVKKDVSLDGIAILPLVDALNEARVEYLAEKAALAEGEKKGARPTKAIRRRSTRASGGDQS